MSSSDPLTTSRLGVSSGSGGESTTGQPFGEMGALHAASSSAADTSGGTPSPRRLAALLQLSYAAPVFDALRVQARPRTSRGFVHRPGVDIPLRQRAQRLRVVPCGAPHTTATSRRRRRLGRFIRRGRPLKHRKRTTRYKKCEKMQNLEKNVKILTTARRSALLLPLLRFRPVDVRGDVDADDAAEEELARRVTVASGESCNN